MVVCESSGALLHVPALFYHCTPQRPYDLMIVITLFCIVTVMRRRSLASSFFSNGALMSQRYFVTALFPARALMLALRRSFARALFSWLGNLFGNTVSFSMFRPRDNRVAKPSFQDLRKDEEELTRAWPTDFFVDSIDTAPVVLTSRLKSTHSLKRPK